MILEWLRKKNKSQSEQWLEVFVVVLPAVFLIRTFVFGLYVVPSGSMETTMLIGERFLADKLTPWFTPIKRGEIVSFNDPTYEYSSHKLVNIFQNYVWGPSNWTKRVIGIPGDHVKGVIENGVPVVYLNGKKLDEPYVNKHPLIYLWSGHAPTLNDLHRARSLVEAGQSCASLVKFDIRSFDISKPFDQQSLYRIDEQLIVSKKSEIYPPYVPFDEKFGAFLDYPYTPLPHNLDEFDVKLADHQYWLMGDNRKGSADSRMWWLLDTKKVPILGRIKLRFFSLQYTKPWSFQVIPGIPWLRLDESWVIADLILHPIDFWKRIRWNRCFGLVH
jgi:signal peptidase I